MESCSSSALGSLSPPLRSTWSSDLSRHPPKHGARSCATIHRTSRPWTCSLPNPWLRPALCIHHRAIGPPRAHLDQRHMSFDHGLDIFRQILVRVIDNGRLTSIHIHSGGLVRRPPYL